MSTYRWSCGACGLGNDSQCSTCSECGCSSNASTEEIEKHKDPKGFEKHKTVEEYKKQIFPLVYFPFFIAIYMHNGRIEIALLSFVIATFLITKNLKLLRYICHDKKAKSILVVFSGTILLFILTRIYFIPDNSVYVGWGALFYFLLSSVFTLYFIKGKRFNILFDGYYKNTNKV